MNGKIVSIFGTSRAKPGEPLYELAFDCGRTLAGGGYTIANGGYGGTMTASAKGAASADGEVIGVTCSVFNRSKANEFVTREIVTDSLQERLNTLIRLGQGYIVLGGGTGTLLELAMVWELKNKNFPGAQKPIIIVGDFWKPLIDSIATDDADSAGSILLADGAENIIELLTGNL